MLRADLSARANREREFFDRYYASGRLEHSQRPPYLVETGGEISLHKDDWSRHGVNLLGDLNGKRVLEIGCGLGVHAVIMAQRGASVCAIDVSPVAIRWTLDLAKRLCVEDRCQATVASVYQLPLEDGSVDAVFGNLVLHHLEPSQAGAEVARVLKPGGIAVFCENSAANPLLMWGRKHISGKLGIRRYGKAEGEYPLRREDINAFGVPFSHADQFYPVFSFFNLLNDFGPLRHAALNKSLQTLDKVVVATAPWVRPYSFVQVVRFQK